MNKFKYSIIIPVNNELKYIPTLLDALQIYLNEGHEIVIVDDGSTDGSKEILENNNEIKLIRINTNKGKGYAIQQGLKYALHNKIILFDGDLELNPSDIRNLMILNKKDNISFVMGYRFKSLNPIKSNFDWGNFMFTSFFNILFGVNHKDILCCAKAFYNDDIKGYNILSNNFDIDVELTTIITIMNKKGTIPQKLISYNRRNILEGKKLKVTDGWSILSIIIKMIKYL